MTRPTPEAARLMKYRKLLKEIWEKEFNRVKGKLKITMGDQLVRIVADDKETGIHPSLFDDYFKTRGDKKKELELIKKRLANLL